MIWLQDVHKAFGEHHVMRGIDLKALEKQVTVVMGGSGQGKSTILRLMMGFILADQGQVWIDGEDTAQISPTERLKVIKKMGMSFQYSALFDSMSVFDNCAFPLREHTHMSEKEIKVRVETMLERLGLPGISKQAPSELSGGMKKRVGVARALMLQPKILLFDEPESGLDPITTTSIGRLIMEMRDSFDITCVVISHNIPNSMMIADKIAMLYHGHIIAEGSPQEMEAHANPIWQQFLAGETEGPYGT